MLVVSAAGIVAGRRAPVNAGISVTCGHLLSARLVPALWNNCSRLERAWAFIRTFSEGSIQFFTDSSGEKC